MERLWAPWRVRYITKIIKPTKGCVFCQVFKEKKDKTNYILIRTQYSFAVLNIYPYNNGHTLVLPNRHVNDLSKLKREEHQDLFALMEEVKQILDETINPSGYNIGINLGRVAGAGYPGHVHIHIVPRWKGDVNFMPVITNVKVISQSLKSLYQLMANAYKKRH